MNDHDFYRDDEYYQDNDYRDMYYQSGQELQGAERFWFIVVIIVLIIALLGGAFGGLFL
jgi:hypothetical protein